MKKNLLFVASALLVATLASCGNPSGEQGQGGDTSGNTTITQQEATTLVNGFDKNLSTTLKATYSADYFLDVETENVGAKGFARKIKETSTIEADFTAGNVYLHIKTVGRNLLTEQADTTKEALIYKEGENYKYLTSTVADPIALKDENAAIAKVNELLKKTSYREAGYVDTGIFTYNAIGDYEHKYFNLSSTNVDKDTALNKQEFSKTADGGLVIDTTFDYVGYGTDQGTSDLGDTAIATAKITTNAKGNVLSFAETYNNATMTMPIMTPAPILKLNGTRSLEASYGETLTKLTTIPHEAVFGTMKIKDAYNGGDVKVLTCEPMAFNAMKPVKNGDKVQVGNWICIKPTPYGANTIKAVLLNNTSTPLADPKVAGGFYCFEAVNGDNEVKVVFEGTDVNTKAVFTVTPNENITKFEMVKFHLVNGKPDALVPVTGTTVDAEPTLWVGFKFTLKEGFEIDTCTIDKTNSFFMGGYYCFRTETAGNFTVTVTTKAVAPAPVEKATVVVPTNVQNGTVVVKYSLKSAPQQGLDLPANNEIGVGDFILVMATPAQGFKVGTITVNGVEAAISAGPFKGIAAVAGTNTIEVTFVAA